MFAQLGDDTVEAFGAAARTMKCLQMANGALYGADRKVHHIHDQKLDALQMAMFTEAKPSKVQSAKSKAT